MSLESLLKERDDHEAHTVLLFKKPAYITQWDLWHDELDYDIEQELRR